MFKEIEKHGLKISQSLSNLDKFNWLRLFSNYSMFPHLAMCFCCRLCIACGLHLAGSWFCCVCITCVTHLVDLVFYCFYIACDSYLLECSFFAACTLHVACTWQNPDLLPLQIVQSKALRALQSRSFPCFNAETETMNQVSIRDRPSSIPRTGTR